MSSQLMLPLSFNSEDKDDDKTISKNNTGDNNNTNQDSSFILKKNKKSGNFTILKKLTNVNSNFTSRSVQRVRYNAYNAYLPYGKEEYNENILLNAIINDSTNLNHNLITTFKKIINTFEGLCDTDQGKLKYSINGKKFFSYMKDISNEDILTDDDKITEKPIKKYQLRLYLRYGAKITHIQHIGELSYDQLKGKRCNLDLELGSMWVNNSTMMYGINIHVTHITVLN